MSYRYRVSTKATVWAAGKDRTIARWSRRIWEKFADYGRKRIPNACEEALNYIDKLALKDAEVFRALKQKDLEEIDRAVTEKRAPVLLADDYNGLEARTWDNALLVSNRYLSAGSPELRGLLTSTEGEGYLIELLLQAEDPSVTEDDAWDVYTDLRTNPCTKDPTGYTADDGRSTLRHIFEIVQGIAPESAKNGSSPGE